jgi:hypothetical protein
MWRIKCRYSRIFFLFWRNSPHWTRTASFTSFLDHTKRRTTVGRTPLDEWLVHRRDLYLTTHNTFNRHISVPPVGFEPTISADERRQTSALARAATGTGSVAGFHPQNPRHFAWQPTARVSQTLRPFYVSHIITALQKRRIRAPSPFRLQKHWSTRTRLRALSRLVTSA